MWLPLIGVRGIRQHRSLLAKASSGVAERRGTVRLNSAMESARW